MISGIEKIWATFTHDRQWSWMIADHIQITLSLCTSFNKYIPSHYLIVTLCLPILCVGFKTPVFVTDQLSYFSWDTISQKKSQFNSPIWKEMKETGFKKNSLLLDVQQNQSYMTFFLQTFGQFRGVPYENRLFLTNWIFSRRNVMN